MKINDNAAEDQYNDKLEDCTFPLFSTSRDEHESSSLGNSKSRKSTNQDQQQSSSLGPRFVPKKRYLTTTSIRRSISSSTSLQIDHYNNTTLQNHYHDSAYESYPASSVRSGERKNKEPTLKFGGAVLTKLNAAWGSVTHLFSSEKRLRKSLNIIFPDHQITSDVEPNPLDSSDTGSTQFAPTPIIRQEPSGSNSVYSPVHISPRTEQVAISVFAPSAIHSHPNYTSSVRFYTENASWKEDNLQACSSNHAAATCSRQATDTESSKSRVRDYSHVRRNCNHPIDVSEYQ